MQQRDTTKPTDIAALLERGERVCFAPSGTSMWPTIVPGRDGVEVVPLRGRTPKRGELLVYRRPASSAAGHAGDLILHRVVRVEGDTFYALGDNQLEVEGPLPCSCALGTVAAILRNGTRIPTTGWRNELWYAFIWATRPLRAFKRKLV